MPNFNPTGFFPPDSNLPAQNGQNLWRLYEYLASPGDMFESKQGGHAFTIGPSSDVSIVNVSYFDLQSPPTLQNQFQITPQRPFIGSVYAVNDSFYLPAQRPGRILIWASEIFDQLYLPTGFDPITDRFIFETPLLDVIQYFSPVAAVSAIRSNKTFYYQILPFTPTGVTFVAVPYYGRKYAHVQLRNNSGGGLTVSVTVTGVNFCQVNATTGPTLTTIVGPVVVADGAVFNQIVLANVNGQFDYLQVTVDPTPVIGVTPNCSLRILESDSST